MKTKLLIDTSTIVSLKGLPTFVEVMPLIVVETYGKEEKSYLDVLEITVDDIRKSLKENKTYKTSQPNIGAIYDMIEKAYKTHDRIIINPISAGISSTYNTLKSIIKEMDVDNKILLLDSKHAAYGGWLLNQELFKLIKENKTNDEIEKYVENFNKNHGLFFFLTDIDFLIKGGRISNFKGFIAKKIKLVISIFWRDGFLKPLAKDKSMMKLFDKSLNLELEYKNKKIEEIKEITYYCNSSDQDSFKNFIEEIKTKYKSIKLTKVNYDLPGAIFVHTGVGGLFFDIFYN